jgi:hypothetical protein
MKTYNWQQSDWPNFQYDLSLIQDKLFVIAEKTGLINGMLSHLTDKEPLTEEKLFDWHLMLLSASPNLNLRVGCWRMHEEPMQVVSGRHGRVVVHYEAPFDMN